MNHTESTNVSYCSWAGIDISKQDFHVNLFGEKQVHTFAQDTQGYEKLLHLLAPKTLVILESTGGYERHVVDALHQANVDVAVVNPRQIRDFARSCGQLCKTDRVDAQVISLFGERMRPSPTIALSAETTHLKELRTRHTQLTGMNVQEKNRLSNAPHSLVENIRSHIAWIEVQLKNLALSIADVIAQDDDMQRKAKLLRSVPGVGPTTTATLLSVLPELGTLSAKKVASLAGLAPFPHESGVFKGKRKIAGGRSQIRRVLYMGTVSGLRYDYRVKAIYDRLIAAGKPPKVAITACMRRMLTWLNAMIRDGKTWEDQ